MSVLAHVSSMQLKYYLSLSLTGLPPASSLPSFVAFRLFVASDYSVEARPSLVRVFQMLVNRAQNCLSTRWMKSGTTSGWFEPRPLTRDPIALHPSFEYALQRAINQRLVLLRIRRAVCLLEYDDSPQACCTLKTIA